MPGQSIWRRYCCTDGLLPPLIRSPRRIRSGQPYPSPNQCDEGGSVIKFLGRGSPREPSFDHLVGAGEEGGRDREAQRLGSLQVHSLAIVPPRKRASWPSIWECRMNWLAVASEWQRNWARLDSAKALGQSVLPHTGATGTAFAWELQLLGQSPALAA